MHGSQDTWGVRCGTPCDRFMAVRVRDEYLFFIWKGRVTNTRGALYGPYLLRCKILGRSQEYYGQNCLGCWAVRLGCAIFDVGWALVETCWITRSISNCRSFDFFDQKFDHSSYSKICAKYHFFCGGLLYQYKIFKNDLNLTIFAQFFE